MMKSPGVVVATGVMSFLAGLHGVSAALFATCPVEVGRWAHGPSLAIAVDGTLGIYGSGAVLRTVDLTSPLAPVVVGEITMPDRIHGAELDGRYAYVAAGEADLRVIDLIDPGNPVEVGSAPYGTQPHHIAVDVILQGNLAFVLGTAGVTLYDISQPASPVERGTYPYDGYHDPADLSINGSVFAVIFEDTTSSEIYFVDYSNPDVLQEVCAYSLVVGGQHYMPTGLVWHGDYVYVSEYNSSLFTIDASDPASPQNVWMTVLGGGFREMVVAGDTLVAAHRSGFLGLFDRSNPARPSFTTSLGGLVAGDLWPVPGSSYVLASGRAGGFDVVDLSLPAAPAIATHVEGIGAIENLVVTGSTGLVASGYSNPPLTSPPSFPKDVTSIGVSASGGISILDTLYGKSAQTLAVVGDLAYIPAFDGFNVVDVTDPSNLTVVGTCPLSIGVDLSVAGAVGVCNAQTLDLSIPTAPAVVGVCSPGSGVHRQSELAGQHAHVTFGTSTFDLVTCDLSNPAVPFVTSTIDLDSNDPSDLLVVRDHLVMTNETQVRTYDLSDPSVPSPDGSLSLTGDPDRMDALGNLLFVTDDSIDGSLMVIDISDLSNPSLVCTVPTDERPTAISQSGGLIYVGFTFTGVQVFGFPDLVFADDFERGDTRHWE